MSGVTNDYFDSSDWVQLAKNTKARANAVNAIIDAIVVGFDRIQAGSAEFFTGQSTTVVTIATGAKSFTTSAVKAFQSGALVIISSQANAANFMFGQVTSYAGGVLQVDVQVIGGSGTLNDWNISFCGLRGPTGASGPGSGDMLAAQNLSDLANKATARINLQVPSIQGDTFTGSVTVEGTIKAQSNTASAAQGPDVIAYRNRNGVANDLAGAFVAQGRDAAGNITDMVKLKSKWLDPANGSEDTAAIISALIAGVETDIATFGPGVQIGAPTGGDKGAGTLNAAAGVYIAGHGTLAQFVTSTYATYSNTAVAIPFDDTNPQITEGVELATVVIAPTNASSTLEIEVEVMGGHGSSGINLNAAIFVDANANSLKAGSITSQGGTSVGTLKMTHTLSAGSTASRTYRLRGGAASGTMYFNGDSSARRFGGVAHCRITVREILPQ